MIKHEENLLSAYSDSYFTRTRTIVERHKSADVTYAYFLRRPCLFAPRLAINWLQDYAQKHDFSVNVKSPYREGQWVGAGEPMLYIQGQFNHLVECETIILQNLGATCVAAYNAYLMCRTLPHVKFLAMDARHCSGQDMAGLMAYAASVGSCKARYKDNAIGFVGNSTDAHAHFFDNDKGLGTMPHALIGYAGSTLKAAQLFHDVFPNENLTVLVDYFGQEKEDSLEVCHYFSNLANSDHLSIRLDTIGGRFCQGLDTAKSYEILERRAPKALRNYHDDTALQYLIGAGVSAAAIWYMRDILDNAGFDKVKIVGSSGFTPAKCNIIAQADAPVDVIGTGSYLPEKWSETYATADIIAYNGKQQVKKGREFLLQKPNRHLHDLDMILTPKTY